MIKNIKKGRYESQPDWMPDCDMYRRDTGRIIIYVTPPTNFLGRRFAYHSDGTFYDDAQFDIEEGWLVPVYEDSDQE